MAKSFLNMAGYPIGLRNNNPGNIRTGDNWQGMIGSSGGFVTFENIAWGIRALGIAVRTEINKGNNTITKLIYDWAPPIENDTPAYVNYVVQSTGFGANQGLTANADTLFKIARAIINVEIGANYAYLITAEDIQEGLAMITGLDITGIVGFSFATALFIFALVLLATMPKMPKPRA